MQQMHERAFLPLSGANTTPTSSYFAPLSSANTSSSLSTEINDAQQEQAAERISSLHSRLQQEAEKIRKWKIHTELDMRQKDHKIQEASQTIESLRKGVLELQIQNENLSLKLQEEIDNRSEVIQRNSATREMCNILKDYASKVEDRLQKCETERTELNYAEKLHSEQLDNLTEQFVTLEITATENCNNLNDQLTIEKVEKEAAAREYKDNLEKTESEVHEMMKISENKTVEIRNLSTKMEDNLVKLDKLQQEYELTEKELESAKLKSLEEQEQLLHKNSEMQALKDSFSREIDELQIERESLHRTIDLQKEEISNLLEKIKTSQDKICRAEENLAHRAQLIDSMKTQVTNMTKQIKEYEQELEHSKRDFKDALEREKASYDKTDLLSTQLHEAREMCKDEENKATEEHDLREKLEREYNEVKKECSKLNKDLMSSKKVEAELSDKAKDMTKEIERLQELLHVVEEQAKERGDEAFSKMQTEVSNTKSFQKEVEKKTKSLADLQDKFKETKSDLTSKNKQIKELEKELNKSKKSLTELTIEMEKATTDHEMQKNELVAVFDKYKKMDDDLAMEQQKELEAARKALEGAKMKKDDMDKLKKDYERIKAELSNTENDQTTEVCQLREELDNLTSKLNEQDCKLEEKETCLENYAKKEAAWTSQENALQNKHEKLIDDCCKKEAKLQKQLDKSKEELKFLKDKEKDNSKKLKELEKIKMKMENSKQENDSVLERLERENQKLKKLEDDYSDKLAEIKQDKHRMEKLQAENTELQENLEKLERHLKKESEEKKRGEKKYDDLQKNFQRMKEQQNEEANERKVEERKTCQRQKNNQKLKQQQKKETEEKNLTEKTQENICENERQEAKTFGKNKQEEMIGQKKKQEEKNAKSKSEDKENIKTVSRTPKKVKAIPERQLTALKPLNKDNLNADDGDSSQISMPMADVMQTPQRGILRQIPTSSAKKRRVMFASEDEDCSSDSSLEQMEIEVDDISLHLKNIGQKCSTPLRLRPSPHVRPSPGLNSPMDYTRTPLRPVPRGPSVSLTPARPIQRSPALSKTPLKPIPRCDGKSQKEKYQEVSLPRSNVRKTPSKPQGKFFKSPPSDRKKVDNKKIGNEKLSWFDSDTVFGFSAED